MKISQPSLAGLALASIAFLLVRPSPAATPHAEPGLPDLAWMAGHWMGEVNGVCTEEVWLAPAGGFLLGMNRSAPKAGKGSFDFLRIEQRKDGLVYVASPGGRPPTDFPLADFGERFVLFENPEHDFPKRLRYELDAAGDLHARVSGDAGDKEQAEEWTWKRQP